MNKMLLLMCARSFSNLDTRELKESFFHLTEKGRTSYARIGKYLTEFARRREYDFIYEYLYETPLDLSSSSCKILARTIKSIPVALLSGYGTFIKVQYKAYQYGNREQYLFFDEYLFRGGVKEQAEAYFWTPKKATAW